MRTKKPSPYLPVEPVADIAPVRAAARTVTQVRAGGGLIHVQATAIVAAKVLYIVASSVRGYGSEVVLDHGQTVRTAASLETMVAAYEVAVSGGAATWRDGVRVEDSCPAFKEVNGRG